MSTQAVDLFVRTIIAAGVPTLAGLEKLLGTAPKPTQENPHWKFYQFDLPGGPFKGGELRLSTAGQRALLSLMPREQSPVVESDLDLKPWGPVRNIDINPQIPPEGTDAYIYDVQGARLAFQFTHVSRRLRTVTVEWGASP